MDVMLMTLNILNLEVFFSLKSVEIIHLIWFYVMWTSLDHGLWLADHDNNRSQIIFSREVTDHLCTTILGALVYNVW